jgi:mannitol-specific phosphotransferase system IIBC component
MEGIDKLICRKEMTIFTANRVSLAAPAALIQTENNQIENKQRTNREQTENKQRTNREQTENKQETVSVQFTIQMQRVDSIYHICGGVSLGRADF